MMNLRLNLFIKFYDYRKGVGGDDTDIYKNAKLYLLKRHLHTINCKEHSRELPKAALQ